MQNKTRIMIWKISNKLQLECGTQTLQQTAPEYIVSVIGREFIETDSSPQEDFCYRLVNLETLHKALNGTHEPEVEKIQGFVGQFKTGKTLYSPSLDYSGSAFHITQGRTRLYVLRMSGLSPGESPRMA